MRRSALAVALLLATAPVAGATEITPEVKPEMRAVEVAVPSIRKDVVIAASQVETRKAEVSRARQFSQRDLTLIAVVLLVVLVAVAL